MLLPDNEARLCLAAQRAVDLPKDGNILFQETVCSSTESSCTSEYRASALKQLMNKEKL